MRLTNHTQPNAKNSPPLIFQTDCSHKDASTVYQSLNNLTIQYFIWQLNLQNINLTIISYVNVIICCRKKWLTLFKVAHTYNVILSNNSRPLWCICKFYFCLHLVAFYVGYVVVHFIFFCWCCFSGEFCKTKTCLKNFCLMLSCT